MLHCLPAENNFVFLMQSPPFGPLLLNYPPPPSNAPLPVRERAVDITAIMHNSVYEKAYTNPGAG